MIRCSECSRSRHLASTATRRTASATRRPSAASTTIGNFVAFVGLTSSRQQALNVTPADCPESHAWSGFLRYLLGRDLHVAARRISRHHLARRISSSVPSAASRVTPRRVRARSLLDYDIDFIDLVPGSLLRLGKPLPVGRARRDSVRAGRRIAPVIRKPLPGSFAPWLEVGCRPA